MSPPRRCVADRKAGRINNKSPNVPGASRAVNPKPTLHGLLYRLALGHHSLGHLIGRDSARNQSGAYKINVHLADNVVNRRMECNEKSSTPG